MALAERNFTLLVAVDPVVLELDALFVLAVPGPVERDFRLPLAAVLELGRSFAFSLAAPEVWPVERAFTLRLGAPDSAPAMAARPWLTLRPGGEEAPILSARVSAEAGSYVISAGFTLASLEDWRSLAGRRATLHAAGMDIELVLEDPARSDAFGRTSLQLSGRSPGCLLDAPYSPAQSRSWPPGTDIRSMVQELCDAAGVDLAWEMANWTLAAGYSAVRATPLAMIRELVTEAAMLVSRGDGTLVVRWKHAAPGSAWFPAQVFSDYEDIVTLSEHVDPRDQVNEVVVVDGAELELPAVELRLAEWPGEVPDGQKLVAVFRRPWGQGPPILEHSGDPALVRLHPLGERTESRTERVELVLGRGGLALPADDLGGPALEAWRYEGGADLGDLTLENGRDLTAEIPGQALAVVRYRIRYTLWLVENLASGPVQVFVQEAAEGEGI